MLIGFRGTVAGEVPGSLNRSLFEPRRNPFTELGLDFFDSTSIYFEGEGGQELGQRGKSKDHRPDLKQVVVGIVLDLRSAPPVDRAQPSRAPTEALRLGPPILDRAEGGVGRMAPGAHMMIRTLDFAAMATQDLAVVPAPQYFYEVTFPEGRVDTKVTFEPRRSRLVAAGVHPLLDSAQVPGEIGDVLLGRSGLAEANGQAVASLVRGWFRALDYLKQNRADAAWRSAGRYHVRPEACRESLKRLELPGCRPKLRRLGGATNHLCTRLRRLSSVMIGHKHRLLTRQPDVTSLMDDFFIRPAVP